LAIPLKNSYNRDFLSELGCRVLVYYPSFDSEKFILFCFEGNWESMGLKARMKKIAYGLNYFIKGDYIEKLKILCKTSKSFSSYPAFIFPNFVEQFGLKDFKNSIQALEIMTQYSSSEFAVRPFIENYPIEMMQQMLTWSKHENHHVRRLASEGCRPRLPWGNILQSLKSDPAPIFPIINNLKNDPSSYVRKSVANNLNDICKDHPDTLKKFVRDNFGKISIKCDQMLKHASRNLLKNSDPEILSLFSYPKPKHVNLVNFNFDEVIQLNSKFKFSFELKSDKHLGLLRLEYAIYFLRNNGSYYRKVFKISETNLLQQDKFWIRKHNFKEITTRKYYPGTHYLSLMINGVEYKRVDFQLIA
jgi:3-methyladenine DNA glycosylase AlkC